MQAPGCFKAVTTCLLELKTFGIVDHVSVALLHDLDVDKTIFVSCQQEISSLLKSKLAGPGCVVNGLYQRRDHLLIVH